MTIWQDSASRVLQQANELADISASPEGITRVYLSPEHQRANAYLADLMTSIGLTTWQDEVGNQWGRKVSDNPTQPTLVIGSHSDTVNNAGRYDGLLGILLGIEAMRVLADKSFPFHIDIVCFADEEGTRFNTALIGSCAVAGTFQPQWLDIADADGITMAQAMQDFGLSVEKIGGAKRNPDDIAGYLEVHIEQGPVLEVEDLPVGVVTGIAGAKRYQIEVIGQAGHAGTVPMHLRHDAMSATAEMLVEIERYANDNDIVATVGQCDVPNGAVNVIAGKTRFTLDIRCLQQDKLDICAAAVFAQLEKIAEKRGVMLNVEKRYDAPAVLCDKNLQQQWCEAVSHVTGKIAYQLPSGAGHDGLAIDTLTKVGMLFVRCEKGISHHPSERVDAEDVAVALACLVEMVELV